MKAFYYDPHDNTVLYLGHNPIVRLILNIMGKRLSDLGRGTHEFEIYPLFHDFVRTEMFNRVLAMLGAELKLDSWL